LVSWLFSPRGLGQIFPPLFNGYDWRVWDVIVVKGWRLTDETCPIKKENARKEAMLLNDP
jgi:hypothetical protein